jgi:pyruvate formate lyase activating enzyme
VGFQIKPQDLAKRLLRSGELLHNDFGVTFSGGEPTLQWPFVQETSRLLGGIHTAIETSGYCSAAIFSQVIEVMDLIMMDLKHMDSEVHRKYTGVPNGQILANLELLKESNRPFIIRVPLIPGVNDTEENLVSTAEILKGVKKLERVELLPYHKTAAAKYKMLGMEYNPGFDTERHVEVSLALFERRGIRVLLM